MHYSFETGRRRGRVVEGEEKKDGSVVQEKEATLKKERKKS